MNFTKTIFAGAFALSIITSGVVAQVKKKPTPSSKTKPAAAQQVKSAALPIDPGVIIGKLPNGLTYYIRSNAAPKNFAYMFLVNKAGSVLETDAQLGMARLVQRIAFDGTKGVSKSELMDFLKRPKTKFDADANSTSSFNETIFQLAVPTDTVKKFEKSFTILANWAGNISFDDADVDKEKALLLQEVQQHGKNQQERLEQTTDPVLLNNSRYAQRIPMGKEDVIKTFTAASVKSFYHDWYRPDLQAVIVVGDFDPKRVEQLIKDNFSALKNPMPEKPRVQYSVPPAPGTVVKFVPDKGVNYTAAQIVVRHPQMIVKTPDEFLQDMRINLFNQMLNSRISEAGQQRVPPFAYAQANYGAFAGRQDAFSAIAEARPGALEAAVKGITNETARAKKFGFTLTELERAKQNTLLQIGNVYAARDQVSSSNFLSQYVQNFLNGSPIPGISFEYNFYVNNIGKINVSDMNALAAKLISDQNRVVIIVAPDVDKDKLPNEKTLLDWMATAEKDAKPYNDDVNTQPLMATIPTGSKVIERQEDSIVNITRLTLKNGVKVILKPTTFKNDQILISGFSFGGTSVASDQDYVSANMAAGVISQSGVADLDQAQLNIKLRGSQLNITPYISETVQGISGSATPADFGTAMQLLYLYFTQPRKDAETWAATLTQAKSLLANRGADPASVYQDTVTAIMNNHRLRAMPSTMDQLNAASLDKAYDFYKARFANAGNFTFTFVGAFKNDQIIPFIETYLGGLPSNGSLETYKNLGMHPAAGQISRTVYKGVSDKSTVQLIYSGNYDYNEKNNLQLDGLEEILNLRLLARLPEKESGAFSLSAGINYLKIPESRYKVTISFLCATANVDKITNDIMDEIGKIKQNGADTTSIKRFIGEEARSIQSQLRQNYFWTGYLTSSAQYGEDPDRILPHIQSLDQVTPESTKEAANKYLSGTNLIKVVLLPEKEKK